MNTLSKHRHGIHFDAPNDSTRHCPPSLSRRCKTPFASRLLFLLLLSFLSLTSQAKFSYSVGVNSVTINGYDASDEAVVIPDTIEGVPVTRIAPSAFQNCDHIVTLTIPATVNDIGTSAFSGCTALTSIIIPEGVTRINDNTFWSCYSLAGVTLPDTVTHIGANAFYYCYSLSSITLPSALAYIGETAFQGCGVLETISIPATVTNIGSRVFGETPTLSRIDVDDNNPAYSSIDGVLYNKIQTLILRFPQNKLATDYFIPDTVTNIPPQAFESCTQLIGVAVPESITILGDNTFSGCSGLAKVSLSHNLTSIGAGAFLGCSALNPITIPGGVTNIGSWAFYGCASLLEVKVPDSVATLGQEVFALCANLGKATTGNGVRTMGSGLFWDCFSLTNVIIGPGPTNIAAVFFEDCTSLAAVVIPEGITGIDELAFKGCGSLTNLTIPASVSYIASNAFGDMFGDPLSLREIYFKGNAPSTSSDLFFWADQVTSYYLPGTTGWDTTFGGRPAMLWDPHAPATALGFGLRAGQFGFTITASSDLTVIVEATPSLTTPAWTPISTNTLIGITSYFTDPQWASYASRFYRFRSL